MASQSRTLSAAGIVLGMGLGGFFDGIVLHQILQWHHLICTTYTCHPVSIADLQAKNRQDGLFHLFTLILTGLGVALLWNAGRQRESSWSGLTLFGAILQGWGWFNLIEGLIDHQILQIHHVRPGENTLFWDMAFLVFGLLLVLVGRGMMRASHGKR